MMYLLRSLSEGVFSGGEIGVSSTIFVKNLLMHSLFHSAKLAANSLID